MFDQLIKAVDRAHEDGASEGKFRWLVETTLKLYEAETARLQALVGIVNQVTPYVADSDRKLIDPLDDEPSNEETIGKRSLMFDDALDAARRLIRRS